MAGEGGTGVSILAGGIGILRKLSGSHETLSPHETQISVRRTQSDETAMGKDKWKVLKQRYKVQTIKQWGIPASTV